jgi:excisionase family DNA binding protein
MSSEVPRDEDEGPVSLAERLLTPDELSEWLQVPKQTVYRWRTRGGGPAAYRVGRHVRYAVSDVERWLQERRSA